MKRWVNIGCWVFVLAILAGCKHAQEDVNNLIATNNLAREQGFQRAMAAAAQTPGNGDDVAIAMAYASNMGQQQFYRERDWVDYMGAVGNLINPWIPWIVGTGKSESSSMTAGRDIFFQSTRADSAWNYESATSEFMLGDGAYAGSNDTELMLPIEGGE